MTAGYRHGAAELARMLATRAQALAPELLPGGRREGHEWVAGSIRGEKGRSLSFRLTGERAGVWCDFAGGERGDALDLVAQVLFGGDRGQAMGWARRWLGLGDDRNGAAAPPMGSIQSTPLASELPTSSSSHDEAEMLKRRRRAQALFLEAMPILRGTPAEAYLLARGIALGELGRQPRALRFHPACYCAEVKGPLPAMVAAVVSAEGEHLATHRTYLAHAAGTWRKAPLNAPKKVLGSYAGGFIPIWRGASGMPLREARHGDALIVAEGIETALSCAVLTPEMRVLAAVSLTNLGRLVLPPAVASVTIAADDDAPGSPAARALQAAIDRFLEQGREVRVARWPGGDFNDALGETAT